MTYFTVLLFNMSFSVNAQYNFPQTSDSGQFVPKIVGKPNYRKAKKLLFNDNFITALPYLEKVIEKNKSEGKNVTKEQFQLAICHIVAKSPVIGLQILDSLESTNSNISPDFYYWKGVASHFNYKFDQAIDYYKKALNKPFLMSEERTNIKRKIQECENAKKLIGSLADVEIVNAGAQINTIFSEHSPTVSNDTKTVYFTSRKNIDGQNAIFTGEYFEDIYSTKLDSNTWEKPSSVSDFNTKEHDACSQITTDNTMIMYRSTRNGDIYWSKNENGKWSKPTPVKGLKTMSYESSGFLSKDGNRIYFTSNKFSDQGDLDIYYMDKNAAGEFVNPKSIGKHINTEYNEESIFITDDEQTLYFSSQGHNSVGGFDIFKSNWDGTKWGNPVNLGFPYNSPTDDIYFSVAANKKYSIFSSFRQDGKGMRDLYLAIPTDKVLASIEFKDSLTSKLVDSSFILVLQSTKTDLTLKTDVSNGQFKQKLNNHEKYKLKVFKGNNLIYTDSLNVNESVKTDLKLSKAFTIPFYHKPPVVEQKKDSTVYEKLNIKEDADTAIISQQYVFGNIFFEHNEAKITKRYFSVLNELIKTMKQYKEIVIEIQGFADEDGDTEYNKQLSNLRAHNVYDFIVSRGISRKRVLFKGYGQTNKFSQANVEHKHQNRRAQFVKVDP